MAGPCERRGCVRCCEGTEMLLSGEDVERLRRLGFPEGYFAVADDGWLALRNRDGRCVFNDGRRCLVYGDRPEGCRSYPVVLGRHGVELDADCPHRGEFADADRGRVAALAARLRAERRKRKRG